MFHTGFSSVITVPSASDADVARATQQIADALQATIAAAPEQWYSFKPMWPPTPEEASELEARATRMLGGPGPTDAPRLPGGDASAQPGSDEPPEQELAAS
jgi:hypothetical protein